MDQIRTSECCKCNHITGRMTSSEFSFRFCLQSLPTVVSDTCPVHLIFNFIHLFLALLGLVFVAVRIFSLVAANRGYQLCMGFSHCPLPWLLLLQSTASRHAGSSRQLLSSRTQAQ